MKTQLSTKVTGISTQRTGFANNSQSELWDSGNSIAMATVLHPLPRTAKGKPAAVEQISAYTPLASVWFGEDPELLERLLNFYPRKKPRKILDATVNGGRFWRGSKRPVIGIDIDSRHRPSLVADNTNMPFRNGSFEVIVYDPPHIPNQGRDNKKDFNTRFGLVLRSAVRLEYR